ncbi:MAG: rod shape-determining protein MreC [Pseudomonadota bacterium]
MSLLPKKARLFYYLIPLFLALIFFSLNRNTFRRAPWYEELLWNILSPPEQLISWVGGSVSEAWDHYIALIGVEDENEDLKKRIAELEGDHIRSSEVEKENERLRSLLAWHDSFSQKTIVARVVASDTRAEFKSITINRGSEDGVQPLMPVIGPKGLVGRIGKAAAHSARVLLITDPNSSVDAMVQRSRARGMVIGAAWHTELKAGYYLTRMEYMRSVSDIRDDDVVVTSGLDELFPPGIPIGTVRDLRASRYGVFHEANVVPFENMPELQEVMVLLSRTEISTAGQ